VSYKFSKNLALADFFAEKILEIIDSNPVLKDAYIVPVPPRPGKIKDSGWDQIDYLVKRLEKTGKGLNFRRCLKRRKSKVQKQLNRTERMENLKGRICLYAKAPETVLVIDDVVTTGSTMEECSAVLKDGGAEKVYGLCLFYN
jgi:ComF family protein